MHRDLFAPDGYVHEEYQLFVQDEPECEETIAGYHAHPKQQVLHQSPARFRIATCGRRWGKTLACSMEMMKFALENERALCWWVAPYYRQAWIAYRIISQAIRDFVVHDLKSYMRIELENGSILEFRSAENVDALRGEGVSFLVVDEAAMIKREVWEEALRPALADRKGKAVFISTPKGRNWFFDLYMRGLDRDFPDYESFRFPSASNPHLPASELEEVKKSLPADVVRQEFDAEFLEESAGVFRGIRHCVEGELEAPREHGEYVIGFDVAKHVDYSVITVIDVNRRHVVAFERFNQVDWKTQIDRLEALVRRYNHAKVWMDSTGVGDAVCESVYDRGIDVEGFVFTSISKKQLIQHLTLLIAERAITFPDLPELLHELSTFQFHLTPTGQLSYSHPPGGHDDCVMSLALACWGLKEHQPIQLFI
jgi:phage FluMu gp28-like protein